ALLVLPIHRAVAPARFSVTVSSNATGPVSGRIEARAPAGWSAAPQAFSLARKGDRAFLELAMVPPASGARSGRLEVPVVAVLDSGERFQMSVGVIDYEHIRPVPFPREGSVAVTLLDLRLRSCRTSGHGGGPPTGAPERW